LQVDLVTHLPVPYFIPNVEAIKFRSRSRGSRGEEHPNVDFEEYDEETPAFFSPLPADEPRSLALLSDPP